MFHDKPSSEALQQKFENLLEKLKALDSKARRIGLAGLEPSKSPLIRIGMETSDGRVTKNSYGVFNLAWQAAKHPEWPAQVEREVAEIRDRIRREHKTKLRFVIWAGMGGSAEDKSAYNAVGLLKRGPKVYVLDSTDPAKLKCVLQDMTKRSGLTLPETLKSTLVVGMAMGMTSYEPVVNLTKLAALYEKEGIDSRPNFIYMTLPGSLVDGFACERGYRKVELQLDNDNSTAGRHSSPMTRGSLYPLALAGVDLEAWMRATDLADSDVAMAWRLAAFLHGQGIAGRDKVTLVLPKRWQGASVWFKQNFEESLGKSEDLGLKMVVGEKPKLANYRSPKDAKQDRVFLLVQWKGAPAMEPAKLNALKRAGYPVAVLTLGDGAPLSGFMQAMHYAVFGIGWLRQMNFVTQPSVELYKSIAGEIFADAERSGGIVESSAWKQAAAAKEQVRFRGAVTLRYERTGLKLARAMPAPEAYAEVLAQAIATHGVEYGELTYFGDLRYCPRGQSMRKSLDRAAESLFRNRLKMPVDVYEGPAMNHGYHEMVIGHGRCFSTVLLSEKPESIPAAGYTADYHRAQFLATQKALADRGRMVCSITVRDLSEASLRTLDQFFREAALALKGVVKLV